MADSKTNDQDELIAEASAIIESELVDEMQAEISRFWESEMDRRGEFMAFEECANLWLETHYAEWRSIQINLPTEGIKKRKYHRVACDAPVKIGIVWSDDAARSGFSEFVRMRDISAGGIYIFSDHDLPHKSLLEISLKVPDNEEMVQAMGVVVRKTPKEKGFGYGVSFSHLDGPGATLIKEFVTRRIAEDVKNGQGQMAQDS